MYLLILVTVLFITIPFWLISKIIGNNRKLLINKLKKRPTGLIKFSFDDASKKFKDDLEVVKIAVAQSSYNFKYASERIRGDENVVLEILNTDPYIINYSLIKTDKIINKALSIDGGVLAFCPPSYLSNKSVVISALQNMKSRHTLLQHLPPSLTDDREVVKAAISINPQNFRYASIKLQGDIELAQLVVSEYGDLLEFLSDSLKSDELIVTLAVRSFNFEALKYAAESFKKDRKIVMAAVKTSGINLKHASIDLRKDFEIAIAAVKNDYSSFEFASETLKSDIDFVLEALEINPKIKNNLSEEVANNPAVKRKVNSL